MADDRSSDDTTIELDVPRSTLHLATLRLVVASVAADMGFSVDSIDDLKLATSEIVNVIVDDETIPGDRLRVTVTPDDTAITIAAHHGSSSGLTLDGLATAILSAVVDEVDNRSGALTVRKLVTDR